MNPVNIIDKKNYSIIASVRGIEYLFPDSTLVEVSDPIKVNANVIPSTDVKYDLGSYTNCFKGVFSEDIRIHGLHTLGDSGSTDFEGIMCYDNFVPGDDLSGKTPSLGDANHLWESVYAQNGTIQKSSRNDKYNVQYLTRRGSDVSLLTNTLADTSGQVSLITYEDVVDFVSSIDPAIFTYDKSGEEQEALQLGLIAEDFVDNKLYKYLGINIDSTDEDGNTINTKGLKVLPVAVAALTCCKYLLEEINTLKVKFEESKLIN